MKRIGGERVCNAFKRGEKLKIGNWESDGERLFLFGNCIALYKRGKLLISDGGFSHTRSTQAGLNDLGAHITLKKGQFYKNGIKWNGKWLDIGRVPKIKILSPKKIKKVSVIKEKGLFY